MQRVAWFSAGISSFIASYISKPDRIIFIKRLLLPTCKTCIHHDGDRGTGFCDCKKYRDRYEKLEGDELERTFCSEIRGTRYCKYEELH